MRRLLYIFLGILLLNCLIICGNYFLKNKAIEQYRQPLYYPKKVESVK
jgi:hypothetical protein